VQPELSRFGHPSPQAPAVDTTVTATSIFNAKSGWIRTCGWTVVTEILDNPEVRPLALREWSVSLGATARPP